MYLDHKKTPQENKNKDIQYTGPPSLLYGSETWTIKASDARRITAADKKQMRRTAGYTWTDYKTNAQIAKDLKITPIFGKSFGIQEKLDTTCKQNASKQITQGNERLLPNGQKESWQTFEQTSGYVRPERVSKWPNFMTDI